MVEEERGLIGTYKALGFGRGAIYGKYLTYAAAACVLGALLGEVGGYILMPLFMRYIFQEMYTIPRYLLGFDAAFGLGGPALFLAGMLGAHRPGLPQRAEPDPRGPDAAQEPPGRVPGAAGTVPEIVEPDPFSEQGHHPEPVPL